MSLGDLCDNKVEQITADMSDIYAYLQLTITKIYGRAISSVSYVGTSYELLQLVC